MTAPGEAVTETDCYLELFYRFASTCSRAGVESLRLPLLYTVAHAKIFSVQFCWIDVLKSEDKIQNSCIIR